MSDIADPLQQMKAAVAANDQDALEHGYSAWLAIPGSRPPTAESPAGCDHPLQIVMDEAARHGNTPAVRFLRHRHFTVRSSTVWLAAGRRALDVLDVLLAPGGWSIDAPLDQHTPSLLGYVQCTPLRPHPFAREESADPSPVWPTRATARWSGCSPVVPIPWHARRWEGPR